MRAAEVGAHTLMKQPGHSPWPEVYMEDARCEVAAVKIDDPRCKGLFKGVDVGMEDHRCKSLSPYAALQVEDSRCWSTGMEFEDPRCQNLAGRW